MGKDNIDVSSGVLFPISAELQGKVFEEIKPFICRRNFQLIKKVSYRLEVEYYPEDDSWLEAKKK